MVYHMIAALQKNPKPDCSHILTGNSSWLDVHRAWVQEKLRPEKTGCACRALHHSGVQYKESRRCKCLELYSADFVDFKNRIVVSKKNFVALAVLSARRVPGYGRGLQRRTSTGVCDGGQLNEAVQELDLLVQRGSYVGSSVFYGVLKRCAGQKDLVLGSQVHALVVKAGYESDAFLANHIICMYAHHGMLEKANEVFAKVHVPSRHMWASIILAHARHGQPAGAIKLYRRMRATNMKPDSHIFLAVLKACASAEDLSSGREVHADILASVEKPSMFVGTGLVDMYSKCGSLLDARKVFDNMANRDVVTWNAMIAGYAQHGLGQEALSLYASMQQQSSVPANHVTYVSLLRACASIGTLHHGKQLHSKIQEKGLDADVVLGNCLVDMYAKCGSLEDAHRVFEKMPTRDVVTWTAMIAGYSQHGCGQKALSLYARMQQECVTPADAVTFVCLLQACTSIRDLHQGKQIHAQIQERGLETDMVIGNCLVDMYSKCGSLEDSRRVFDNLTSRDVVSWNAMILGYAQHGQGQEALALYASMEQQGIIPTDAVTFISLLQACGSVAGLEKGKEIHAQLSKLGLEATDLVVANALIDMYRKCGSMLDAEQVFDALSAKDSVSWNALIAGFARQGDRDRVFHSFERMRQSGIQPTGVTFLSVLTLCSHLGLVEKGESYFESMSKDYGIHPALEHYTCMVDLLGRAGKVEKAMEMVTGMPFEPDLVVWRSMLGACRKWKNVELGRLAFEHAVRLDAG